ncbi:MULTISPECIES: hypothetical protein [Mesorhizobium]|uniref:Transposase n=2 Tax=Mesorhizobium TaxID=68287 RepID=A0ABW4WFZ4_9HYPH|nr:hypothetical protein [Mesorhizobium sophorae]
MIRVVWRHWVNNVGRLRPGKLADPFHNIGSKRHQTAAEILMEVARDF